MVPSHSNGELTLTLPRITQFLSTKSAPNTRRAMSMESSARCSDVIEPMKALSEYLICEYTISRWRLLTGMSVGSHTVPPEWCSQGLA